MKVDPESVYLEPTPTFLLERATGRVTAPRGLTVHWKEGARWQSILLLPDDGESFGAMCGRIGAWIDSEPETWTTELLHGTGRTMSHDAA